MRKINKIMMATVSILLTLVLISSCVLSGIFAKYVTSKTASSQMQFERFGVVVNTVVDKEALEELGATVTLPDANSNEVKSGVYSVTIENLPIYPGIGANPNANDSATNDVDGIYNNLVKFVFSGKANVPAKVSIGTDIEYSNLNLDSSTPYLPLGFTCNAYNGNTLVETFSMGDPGRTSDSAGAANRANNIAKNFKDKFGMTQDVNYAYTTFQVSTTDNIVFKTKIDNTNTTDKTESNKTVNAFSEGIYWPFHGSETNDARDTWLVQNNPDNASISITYPVKVEQTGAIPRS